MVFRVLLFIQVLLRTQVLLRVMAVSALSTEALLG